MDDFVEADKSYHFVDAANMIKQALNSNCNRRRFCGACFVVFTIGSDVKTPEPSYNFSPARQQLYQLILIDASEVRVAAVKHPLA